MNKNRLQVTTNFGNPYEQLRLDASSKKYFNEDDWENISKGNTSYSLESYAEVLNRMENVDEEELNKRYNFKYADGNSRLAALYTEITADRTEPLKNAKVPKIQNGHPVTDSNGNAVMEDFVGTEYDYYSYLIKLQNDANYNVHLQQTEQERKDAMNGFGKFLLDFVAAGNSLGTGFITQIGDVINLVEATGHAVEDSLRGEKTFADSLVENLADGAPSPFVEAERSAIEFEARYTDFRNLDGSYTNLGKYLGSALTSVGQMMPSMLAGYGLGSVATSLGAAGGTAAKVGTAVSKAVPTISQTIFYSGMTASKVEEMATLFALDNVTVSSGKILNNAVLKTALQWGVERTLGMITGGSSLDNLVYGKPVTNSTMLGGTGSVTAKTLSTAAMKRVASDFAREGLEEVLQDTSDFFVDQGYAWLINENFGKVTDISFQSLLDAFIIGGFVSFGGSALSILSSDNAYSKAFSDNNAIIRKLAGWEYGLNLETFVNTYSKIAKISNSDPDFKNKSVRKIERERNNITTALTQMYASYRIISSLYAEIGEQRFKDANKVLTRITEGIRAGRFNKDTIRKSATDLYNSVFGDNSMAAELEQKHVEEAMQKLIDAKLAEIVEQVERGEEVLEIDENSPTMKAFNEVFEKREDVERIVTTKYGENVVLIDNTLIVPHDYLANMGEIAVNMDIKQQEFVEDVITNAKSKYKVNVDEIRSAYVKLTGSKNSTAKDAVTALLYDPDLKLFKTLLVTANVDMYALLTGITNHINITSKTDVADETFKNALNKTKKRMIESIVNYLKVQPNANYQLPFLSKAQINSIMIERWANNIYSRVIIGEELSERDLNVLMSRIKNMAIKDTEKKMLLANINSSNADIRESTMKRIDGYYNNLFTTKYDGKTYMPMTCIPNMAFNNYLKNLGLTLLNWLSISKMDNATKTIIVNTYGDLTEDTVLKFRSKMFSDSVSGAYEISFINDKMYIVSSDTNEIVGFTEYDSKIDAIISGSKLDVARNIQSVANDTKNIVAITKSLLSDSVPDTVANMITLDDMMYNSSLLNKNIQYDIVTKYGKITPENTFVYLRSFILKNTKNTSIVVKPNGSYSYVNVKPMMSIFLKNKIDIAKDTKLSDILKPSYLNGILADTKIVITNRNIAAEYSPFKNQLIQGKARRVFDNTIYIGKNILEGDQDYLKFAIAHEIEHAIQFENKLNCGMNENWLQNVQSVRIKKQIVDDVRKHKPGLFTENMTREQIEKAVSKFIYHTSGESMAMGIDATSLVDFYPTIVTYNDTGTVVTMPWGTSYNLNSGLNYYGVKTIVTNKNNTTQNKLVNATTYKTLPSFIVKPENCFIMPDGSLRSVGEKSTLDVVKELDNNIDYNYFDTVPRITYLKDEFGTSYNIDLSMNMSQETFDTLIKVIDALYKQDAEFTLSKMSYDFENDAPTSVESDLAKDVQGIIRAFNELAYSQSMSLIKVADNLWEVEGIKDLVEVNKEYADNVKEEYMYGEKRDISFSYSTVHDDFPSMDTLFEVSNYRNNEYPTADDALDIAQNLSSFDYIFESVLNECINRKIIEEKYRDEILRLFEEGQEDDVDVNLLNDLNKVTEIIANYVDNSYDFYNDFYSKKYKITDEDVKKVFDAVYKYVINFDLNDIDNVYDLLTGESGKIFKNVTLEKLYNDSIKDKTRLSYSNFLELDIPYFRFQSGDIKPSDFVSASINIVNEDSFVKYLDNTFSTGTRWFNSNRFVVGTVKLKNVLCYIDNGMNEILLPTSELADSKIYDITHSNNYEDNNMYLTKPVPSIISSQDILPRDRSKNYEKELFYNIINNEVNYLNYINELKNLVNEDEISSDDGDNIYFILNNIEKFYATGRLNFRFDFEKQYLRILYKLVLKHSDFKDKYSFYEDANNIGFVNNDTGELFISEFNTYVIVTNTETGNVITDEQVTTNLGPDDVRMSLAKNIKSDTKKVKNKAKEEPMFNGLTIDKYPSTQSKNKKYTGRKFALNKDGTVKTYKTASGEIKPVIYYEYDNKEDNSRYVSQKEAQDSNLKYFVQKYNATTMSPELKRFIILTTDTPVAEELMDKINGKHAGTLTRSDVFDYFRNTDLSEMDLDTFTLINKSFFKNDAIKTPAELQNYVTLSPFYYAARYTLSGVKNINKKLVNVTDANITNSIVNSFINNKENEQLQKVFTKKVEEYQPYFSPVSDKYLKVLWLKHFDGSLSSASSLINIATYAYSLGRYITGETSFTSTDKNVSGSKNKNSGSVRTVGDFIKDDSAMLQLDEVLNNDKVPSKDKRLAMLNFSVRTIAKILGRTDEAVKKSKDVINIVNSLSKTELNKVYLLSLLSDVLGIKSESEMENAGDLVQKIADESDKTPRVIVNRFKRTNGTIKTLVIGGWAKRRFLNVYNDIFDDNLNIKENLYKQEDGTYSDDLIKLRKLEERVNEAKDAAKQGVFSSAESFEAYKQNAKEMQKQTDKLIRTLSENTNKKEIKVVHIDVQDDYVDITTTREMPEVLMQLLDFEFKKGVKSRTKYLTNDTDYHFLTNFAEFEEGNAEILANLTQSDVDEIVDFYTNSAIVGMNAMESKVRLYNAVQIYMSAYLLSIETTNNFVLSEEQRKKLTDRTELLISSAGQILADWRAALKKLKPAEDIANSLAKSIGIDVDQTDITNLLDAVKTGDADKINTAKKQMYENTVKNYRISGRKTNVLDKILQFQRISMLSGPGTWVRNWTSNVLLTGVNSLTSVLGSTLTSKFKRNIADQYKISGTKVTTQATSFIQQNLLQNGLLDSISDSLSKYDERTMSKNSANDNITKMITKNIATNIFYNNYFDEKVGNKYTIGAKKAMNAYYKFIYKMLSDDKFVKNATLKYFGKMLTENQTDLSQGLTNDIQGMLADAYTLAAADYMHKSNFLYKLEGMIKKEGGSAAYFVYKQIFPFAGAAWNWFTEGLNYTPVGLISNIIKFAKLENVVEKLEAKREKGENVMSSKFAKYYYSRNIGKGVIGSIGCLIGTLLALFGVARIDEEDNKYKLCVGDTYIDISSLYGTQSIFLSVSITQSIIDTFNGEYHYEDADGNKHVRYDKIMSVINTGFNSFLTDSIFEDVWNTFRYTDNFGDYALNLPFSILQTFVPNMLRTIVSITEPYKVKYSDGVLGKLERCLATVYPYSLPKQVDIYTGETQLRYDGGLIGNITLNAINKLSPIKIHKYNITDTEKEITTLGVNKGMLSGRYTINGSQVKLTTSEIIELNMYYGELNKKDLDRLMTDKDKYKVLNDKGVYVTLAYSKMTEEQKATVIKRIMSNNSSYSKVYFLTSKGYEYYATDSEYKALRELGITKNVYHKTKNKEGFIKR